MPILNAQPQSGECRQDAGRPERFVHPTELPPGNFVRIRYEEVMRAAPQPDDIDMERIKEAAFWRFVTISLVFCAFSLLPVLLGC